MKEVSCNHAEECTKVEAAVFGQRAHWCHAATPHPVTEACERSYCREVRRQVQCERIEEPVMLRCDSASECVNEPYRCPHHKNHPEDQGCHLTRCPVLHTEVHCITATVAAAGPPDTCTRRVLGICDLSGIACAVVYDGVTCRRGRPPSPAEDANDLGELRALAHDRDMKQRKVWHAFGRSTYRGVPVVKSDYLVPETADTMTAAAWEAGVYATTLEVVRKGIKPGERYNVAIAKRVTAAIVALPRIRQEGGTGE